MRRLPHEVPGEAAISAPESSAAPKRIWDIPTRLFHWSLVVLVFFAWGTAEYDHLDWHVWCGDAILGLLIYRLYWGLVGASTAKFASFVKGPGAIWAYLRGDDQTIGHNPLGALSVVAMLLLLFAQVVLGLFAYNDDGGESGPLSSLVSYDQGVFATHWHRLLWNAVLALIALLKRDNLIGPMITGRKRSAAFAATFAQPWLIIPGVLVAGALVYAVMKAFKF